MLTTPDHDDALTSPPAFAPVGPKPQGFFADCDPATGEEGTTLRAEDFNEAALNLRALLDAASIVGTKGLATMLRSALHRLYAGLGRSVVATVTLSPDDAGLILIDATTADITITLPAASALAHGQPTFYFVRTDTTTRSVRVTAAGSDVISIGVLTLDDQRAITLRSNGTTTWYPLTATGVLRRGRTLQVSPTGTAQPVDPLGGTPFDTVANALLYLRNWRLEALVTINVAAGTYISTAAITVDHLDARNIRIQGAGVGQTILRFNSSNGIVAPRGMNTLATLTLQGDGLGTQSIGLRLLASTMAIDTITVDNFNFYGIWVTGGGILSGFNTITIQNCKTAAVWLDPFCQLIANYINAITNATAAGATGQIVVMQAYLSLTQLDTNGGARGLNVQGSAGLAQIDAMNVLNSTVTTSAVWIQQGAVLRYPGIGSLVWTIAQLGVTYHTLRAERYGGVFAGAALVAGSRAVTSPAVNVLGNTQAFIEAS